jgi:hydroxypyruvate isomerase
MERRSFCGGTAAALGSLSLAAQSVARKGRLKQGVSRWCFEKIPLDDFARECARLGMKSVDLLAPAGWPVVKKYGLIASMPEAGGGTISDGLNRKENHAKIEQQLREGIERCAAAGVPNIIAFSGNRRGLSDQEGMENCVIGLNRVKAIAEDKGVTICMELLNSKVDHKDYQCDHTAWGAEVCKRVGSPRVKLLYDIYHMQIMEGDLIDTIRENHPYFGHYHTGGVPGRGEIDDTQEINYPTVMKAIVETGFKGFVGQEFVPKRPDALASLRQAVQICDV